MMLSIARAFIGKNGLLLAAAAGLIALALTYDTSRVNHGRAIERQKTEASSATTVEKGNFAASKSRTALPTDSGVRRLPEVTD